MAMANKVPFGIASAGSFKSPDKFAPATIPFLEERNVLDIHNLNQSDKIEYLICIFWTSQMFVITCHCCKKDSK